MGSSSTGDVSFFVHKVASTDQLQVDDGHLNVGGFDCTEPNGSASQVNIPVDLLPTPIVLGRFDFERSPIDEDEFQMSVTIIGVFTSPNEVQGTATAVVVSVKPPWQCTIAPGTVQWSAKYIG